jgi:hypothetical protein
VIYVPFTFIHPPTWEALERAAVPVPVNEYDGYLMYFRERWKDEVDFTNVEHDVIVQPGQLEQFDMCPGEWCVVPELGGSPSLSLARFRAGFIEANPRIWGDEWVLPSGQGRSWTWLDSHLIAHADREPCLHLVPPAVNARPRGSLH